MRVLTAPPYKSDNNIAYTSALFYEQTVEMQRDRLVIKPIFTLYDDREGFISARKTFIELGDPTGYEWANKYLGDWGHWQKLMNCEWFRKAVDAWNTELHAKNQAEAIRQIKMIAENGGNQSLAAAKYIAEKGWTKTTNRGRPSKEEVSGELKRAARVIEQTESDRERIGLKVINGGREN